jgi:hypothetical protein
MSGIPRSANLLVDIVLNTPGLLDQVKVNPEETLRKLATETTKNLPPPPMVRESGIYYIVVSSLGFVAIAAMLGAIYLSTTSTTAQIPDVLTALGSAAIGALAGVLAPSPTRKTT